LKNSKLPHSWYKKTTILILDSPTFWLHRHLLLRYVGGGKFQNRTTSTINIRYIFSLRMYDHISEYRLQLQCTTMGERRDLHTFCLLFKILYDPLSPNYLRDSLSSVRTSDRCVLIKTICWSFRLTHPDSTLTHLPFMLLGCGTNFRLP
jgi:hypothetical protein